MKILSIHATANAQPPVNTRSSGNEASFLRAFLEQAEGGTNDNRLDIDDAAPHQDVTPKVLAEDGESGGRVPPDSAGPDMAPVSIDAMNLPAGVKEVSGRLGDIAPGGARVDVGASNHVAGRDLSVLPARSEFSLHDETRPPSAAPPSVPGDAPLDAGPLTSERRETSPELVGTREEGRILTAGFIEGEPTHRDAATHEHGAGYVAREAIGTNLHRGQNEAEARIARPVSDTQVQIGADLRTKAQLTFVGVSHQQANQALREGPFPSIEGGELTAGAVAREADAATRRFDAPDLQSLLMPAAVSKGSAKKTLAARSAVPPEDPVPVGKGNDVTTNEGGQTGRTEAETPFSSGPSKLTQLPFGNRRAAVAGSGQHAQSLLHGSVNGLGDAPRPVSDMPAIRDLPAPEDVRANATQTAGTKLTTLKSGENPTLPGAVLPTIEKAAPSELIQTPETDSIAPATSETAGPTGARPGAEPSMLRADAARMPIAQMVEIMARRSERAVEIALNPKELGKVRLSLAAADGGLTLLVVAERSETLDLMRRHIDTLAQEFRRMGYSDLGFEFSQSGSQPDSRSRSAHTHSGSTESMNAVPETMAPVKQPNLADSSLDLRI